MPTPEARERASAGRPESRYPSASAGPRNAGWTKVRQRRLGPETFRVNEISSGENFAAGRRRDGRRPKKPPQNRAQLTADEIKEGGGQLSCPPPRRHARLVRLTRRVAALSFSMSIALAGRIDFSREESIPRATAPAYGAARRDCSAWLRSCRSCVYVFANSPPRTSGGDRT